MEYWYDYAGDPVSEQRWETWKNYSELPAPGVNKPFDDFLEQKGLSRESLSRVGARWAASEAGRRGALAFLFPEGIKYRALDGTRWAEAGVRWTKAKKVRSTVSPATAEALVVEGETDGAAVADALRKSLGTRGSGPSALSVAEGSEGRGLRHDSSEPEGHDTDPDAVVGGDGDSNIGASVPTGAPDPRGTGTGDCDVYILPAGARHVPASIEEQLNGYERVWIGLDNDEAGREGTAQLLELLPNARRLAVPEGHKDWCDFLSSPSAPASFVPASFEVKPPRRVFSVREVLAADLGSYAENNWFEHDILPIGGEMVCHGPIKSLKSFVALDLARAITTGMAFAEYYEFCRPAGPGRVLMIQFEIPPRGFQSRLASTVDSIPVAQRDLFYDNFMIFGIADRSRPRLKMQDQAFVSTIRRAVEEAEADVVMFDPMQRMTGGANADKAHEMEPILDVFSQLQNAGVTVVYTHHDTKSGGNDHAAYNMSGSQRFGADADSICSLIYDPKIMIPDDNAAGIKQRNFVWTLRSGSTIGRSITASQNVTDPERVDIKFDSPIEAAPVVTSGTPGVTSSASATGAALGMPDIS